jgi:hypothetical protein
LTSRSGRASLKQQESGTLPLSNLSEEGLVEKLGPGRANFPKFHLPPPFQTWKADGVSLGDLVQCAGALLGIVEEGLSFQTLFHPRKLQKSGFFMGSSAQIFQREDKPMRLGRGPVAEVRRVLIAFGELSPLKREQSGNVMMMT